MRIPPTKLFQQTYPPPLLFFFCKELIIKFNGITCPAKAIIHLHNQSEKRFIVERNCFLNSIPRTRKYIRVYQDYTISVGRNCFFQDSGQLFRRQKSFSGPGYLGLHADSASLSDSISRNITHASEMNF